MSTCYRIIVTYDGREIVLTEHEKDILAQALVDYAEGVERNCEDPDMAQDLLDTVQSIERKVLAA